MATWPRAGDLHDPDEDAPTGVAIGRKAVVVYENGPPRMRTIKPLQREF